MQNILVIITIIVSIILVGCTNTGERVESSNVATQEQLTETIEQLETELDRKQAMISELESENKQLKGLVDHQESQDQSQVIVGKEGLFIKPDLLYPEDISDEVILNLLGEPINANKFEDAHGGFTVVEFIYDNFSITIQKQPNKQLVKWLTIKDSNFVTERGITVGSSKSQVVQAYGENFSENLNGIYYGEKTGISFSLEDGYVKEIDIWYTYE
ncbi:hypothetical protein [Salirhabdus salicampi]|uniref:hypothetical protein n=1 Tax=Salirhabdus salicampi TaxID=476102 RepID=UPI0020C1BCD1|nr:hypothetical protein [Salirhabdus salicampi]MCP8615952.1 hypothetical protein [Salirhabdus salicampi]